MLILIACLAVGTDGFVALYQVLISRLKDTKLVLWGN